MTVTHSMIQSIDKALIEADLDRPFKPGDAAQTSWEALPFVSVENGQATSLWAVERTGDYSADCATGRAHASALTAYIAEAGDPSFLPLVARDIVRAGQWTGVEISFFHGMAGG